MNKNIYIKDSDLPLIERIENQLSSGESLSSLFAEFLKERAKEIAARPASVQKLKVVVGDPPITKTFEGRWLCREIRAEDDEDGVSRQGVLYSVAQTKNNRIVVYEHPDDEEEGGEMEVYGSLAELENAKIDNRYPAYPTNVLAVISSALGVPFEVAMEI